MATASRSSPLPKSRAGSPSEKPGWASSAGVRSRMVQQRSRDTRPEVRLRSALHAMGLRFRVHRAVVPGTRRTADVTFGPARVAVFVDGCFWHGCPEHGVRRHDINSWYWPGKIQGNRERDADTDERLRASGWIVIRVWEHENELEAAEKVAAVVRARRKPRGKPHLSLS